MTHDLSRHLLLFGALLLSIVGCSSAAPTASPTPGDTTTPTASALRLANDKHRPDGLAIAHRHTRAVRDADRNCRAHCLTLAWRAAVSVAQPDTRGRWGRGVGRRRHRCPD